MCTVAQDSSDAGATDVFLWEVVGFSSQISSTVPCAKTEPALGPALPWKSTGGAWETGYGMG